MLVACGGGPDGPDAGDSGADVGDAGAFVTPPDIPWLDAGLPPIALPVLTPCPEGWHEVLPDTERGAVTCHPYEGAPEACPDGAAHFFGESGCTPVGAPCPAGDFPEGLPTGVEVLYVLASATPGGDGSEGSPLSTITDAINAASSGTVIAIGKGTYDEDLRVGPGITLFGACARETRLTASSPGILAEGVITVPSADVRLINLRVGPADLPGVAAYGTRASVSIDGLIIEGTRKYGLFVNRDARVEGHELSITGTRADGSGSFGRGVEALDGGIIELTRVRISESRGAGVLASRDGASVTLSDAVVESNGGWGLGLQFGATAVVNRVLFSGNRDVGVFAGGAGTTLTLSDAVVESNEGRGLVLQFGVTADVARVLFSENHDLCVYASDEGTSLTLSDVVVESTQARQSDGTRGRGLVVQLGATVEVTRARFSRNRELGVLVYGAGTSLTLSDVVVEDTLAQESDGAGGIGLAVESGATARVTGALFSESRMVGVFADGAGTSLTLSDVVVEGTEGRQSDGAGGRGLNVQLGATAEVSRARFTRNRSLGVFAGHEGASVTLSDVVIEDTLARESDGTGGRGLGVESGATAEVSRALLSQNREFGVAALGSGVSVQLTDVVVERTEGQTCGQTTCSESPFGVGIAGILGASLMVNRFDVSDSVLCGVFVADSGEVDLSVGQVSGSPVGVCLQVDGYAVSRLTESVRYIDNGTNLEATSLPVPQPVSSVAPVE